VKPKFRRNPKMTATKRRGGSNMLAIRTLQPKELMITIPYRQTIFYSDMGAIPTGSGATWDGRYYLCGNGLIVNMTDPLRDIVKRPFPVGYTGVADGQTTNPADDLSPELDEKFDGFERMQVIASTCTIQATQLPNQYKLSQYDGEINAQGRQYYGPQSNSGGVGGSVLWQDNHQPYQAPLLPNLNGNVYAACVKHRDLAAAAPDQTLPITSIGATLHKLKTEVPGMQMKNLTCMPTTTKSVKFTSTYTAKSSLGIKDYRDNEPILSFSKTMPPQRMAHTSFGLFNEQPPKIPVPNGSNPPVEWKTHKCPLFKVEILVNYKILMLRRKNIFFNNEARDVPVPDAEMA